MHRLPIKALSVNDAYRGRRFATKDLEKFKLDVHRILPPLTVPDGKLSVSYRFGVSSKSSDGDNLIKAFQDIVAKKYGFNDKKIYEWHVRKEDVAIGAEYIEFEIRPDEQKIA